MIIAVIWLNCQVCKLSKSSAGTWVFQTTIMGAGVSARYYVLPPEWVVPELTKPCQATLTNR